MTLRLGALVVQGELFNTRRYSVHGWLELEGSDQPLVFNLTGDCAADLAGRHIRFAARREPTAAPSARDLAEEGPDLSDIAWQQIGPTGTMTAERRVKVADCSAVELYQRIKLGEPPPMRTVRCLYLEWFSQNGRVLVELPEPEIEFVPEPEADTSVDRAETTEPADEDAWHEGTAGLGTTSIPLCDDGAAEQGHEAESAGFLADDEEDCDDPYGLIPDELQRHFDSAASDLDHAIGVHDERDDALRELELMDELIERGEGEPVGGLFEKPLKLPCPEELDDQQAEKVLKLLLAELAIFGIALDVCEHFSPRDTYRLLVEQICREERAFPELRSTQWVQHFMTAEFCPQCAAELEREMEEFDRRSEKDSPERRDEGTAE